MKLIKGLVLTLGMGMAMTAQAERNKVLMIGIDGLNADVHRQARTPNIDALLRQGYLSGEGWTADTAVSGSGWASLFTGVERDKHGVRDNDFDGSRFEEYPDVLTRIERLKPATRTAALLSWPALASKIPWQADLVFDGGYDDDRVHDKALSLLAQKAGPDVLLIDYNEPDGSGHRHDYFDMDSPQYVQAVERIDQRVGELVRALGRRPQAANENWLVVIATDHGGSVHHGANIPEDRRTLVGFSGRSVSPLGLDPLRLAPRQVDVVPTILAHMGLAIPAGLDGRRMARPPAEPVLALGRNLLVNGDAEYSVGRLDRDYDGDVPGWRKGQGGQVVDYGQYAWLPAPGPQGRRNLFIGRDPAVGVNTLTQRVPLTGAVAAAGSFRLSADLGAATGHRARVFLRFQGQGHVASFTRDGVVHVFKGEGYWRYSLSEGRVLNGYPEPIRVAWPGLEVLAGGARGIDAVLANGDNLYFFKGDQYLLYRLSTGSAVAGYPRPIAGNWPGLERLAGGARDLGPIFRLSDGGPVFFTKGAQYLRYDLQADRADSHYPAYLSGSKWPGTGFWPADWDGFIASAGSDAFVLKPGESLRYDRAADRAVDARPRPLDRGELAELQDMYAGESFELAPDGARGMMRRYVLQGAVPEGAKVAEVEIRFEHGPGASTSGDAYADNLSLELLP